MGVRFPENNVQLHLTGPMPRNNNLLQTQGQITYFNRLFLRQDSRVVITYLGVATLLIWQTIFGINFPKLCPTPLGCMALNVRCTKAQKLRRNVPSVLIIIWLAKLLIWNTVFDLISEHALISGPPFFLKLKKTKNLIIFFFFFLNLLFFERSCHHYKRSLTCNDLRK